MTTTTTIERPDRVRAYDSVTAATMALGSKTYTGTVAGGGGGGDTAPPVRAEQ